MLYEIKAQWETHESTHRRIKLMMNLDDRIQKDNEGLPCIGHALSCVIQANGDVVMCEKRRHDPVVFGNINKQRFGEIWTSNHRKEVSRKLMNPESQKGCEVCRITKFNRYFSRLGQLKTRNFI
jgi:radical SAM protein with 4Fe4S-binding SPASM domain